LSHTKKGLTSITVGFNEALNSVSASNQGLYRVFAAVKKHKKTVYTKKVAIRSVLYNSNTHSVTINLANPHKGAVQVMVEGGILATNGTSSGSPFVTVVK
jgi:hypothetical protein